MAVTETYVQKEDPFFNLNIVYECFNSALLEEDNVDLGFYLEAYRELCKFCSLMGTVFGFVKDEIESKSLIIMKFRSSDTDGNFSSLKSMLQYEMEHKLLEKPSYESGSRTLLRLHRGLDFIRNFLCQVANAGPEEKTSHIGRSAYQSTLAKYHPWVVRTGAHMAMILLPRRDTLFKQVCGRHLDSSMKILPKMLEVTNEVYDRVQRHYHQHDLLDLA